MGSWTSKLVFLFAGIVAAAAFSFSSPVSPRGRGLLTNDVYVWQRAWTDPVREAIALHGTNFGELVALSAEVTWLKSGPHVVRVPLDYELLRAPARPVGLALRVGSFSGPMAAANVEELTAIASALLAEAKTNNLAVSELQVDFDCAESKLDDYRAWISIVRAQVAPVPVTITTLPAWLKRSAFKQLIAAVDGYVLQVHSLDRPKTGPFTLCNPANARAAVEQAARLGQPFRVALPTYGYAVGFDKRGHFAGLSAEGPSRTWPADVSVREVRADAAQLASLISEWQRNRPQALTGIIWYRLPIQGETLNWNWPTLASVMNGHSPRSDLKLEVRRPKTGLLELDLLNAGTGEHRSNCGISVSWNAARLIACDGLDGFEAGENGFSSLTFSNRGAVKVIGPGERRMIGWLRLDHETEVKVALEKN
jgi:hypothetical protein